MENLKQYTRLEVSEALLHYKVTAKTYGGDTEEKFIFATSSFNAVDNLVFFLLSCKCADVDDKRDDNTIDIDTIKIETVFNNN